MLETIRTPEGFPSKAIHQQLDKITLHLMGLWQSTLSRDPQAYWQKAANRYASRSFDNVVLGEQVAPEADARAAKIKFSETIYWKAKFDFLVWGCLSWKACRLASVWGE